MGSGGGGGVAGVRSDCIASALAAARWLRSRQPLVLACQLSTVHCSLSPVKCNSQPGYISNMSARSHPRG
eukprot:366443-Chlamydomonas_euryale.AAC.12